MHQVRTLEHAMRQVLAEMTLLQYGRTQAFASSSGDTERDPRPAGESHPLAEKWLAEWLRDPTEDTLLMARAELDAWKRSVPRDEDDSGWDEEAWMLSEGEGYTAEEVSKRFRVTVTYVRRLRVKNDRDAEFGKDVQALVPSASKETRVVLLTERGLSSRQVADQVGLHKTQVLRILARSRNAA